MRTRPSPKSRICIRLRTCIAKPVLVAMGIVLLAGCGDDGQSTRSGAVSAATGPAAVAPTGGATSAAGATGATSPGTEGEGESVDRPTGDETPQSGDEEGARTPVVITIEHGRFAARTPDVVHVPSFIAVELDVGVRDGGSHTLTIVRDGEPAARREQVKPGYNTILLDGLRPGKRLTVRLGSSRTVVVADAEPGP